MLHQRLQVGGLEAEKAPDVILPSITRWKEVVNPAEVNPAEVNSAEVNSGEDPFHFLRPIVSSGSFSNPEFIAFFGHITLLTTIGSLQLCVDKNCSSREHCAFVDTNGRFDLMPAEAAGIDLSRMLWVRCANRYKKLNAVEQAFKAADILVHHGGFKLIVVDLAGVAERLIRRVPLTTWHRFSRAAERTFTTLIFLTSIPVAQSCANLSLKIKPSAGIWTAIQLQPIRQLQPAIQDVQPCVNSMNLPHTRILSGIETQCEVVREKLRKPIESFKEKLPLFTKRA